MKHLIDKILLFMLCLTLLFGKKIETVHTIAFLAALITVSISSYYSDKKYNYITACAYFMVSWFIPAFRLFLPVVWYDFAGKELKEKSVPFLFGGISYIVVFSKEPLQFAVEILLFAAVGYQLGKRTFVEERSEERLNELRDDTTEKSLALERANKDLMEKQDYEIYMATLQERNRIAREIHDNVGHLLTRSILQVGALKAINKDETAKEALEEVSGTLNQAMGNIRSSVHDLHDESVDLKTAVQELVDRVTGYEVNFDYDMGTDIPKSVKYSFISIIREALNNIAKHSNATAVTVTLREQPGFYQLSVKDNGTGIKKDLTGGIGLSTMKERVAALGGTFKIRTEKGFEIFISVLKEV